MLVPDSGAVLTTELRGSPYKLGIRAERGKGGAVNSKDDGSITLPSAEPVETGELWVQRAKQDWKPCV